MHIFSLAGIVSRSSHVFIALQIKWIWSTPADIVDLEYPCRYS